MDGKKLGSSLLTLIISGLTLHCWFFFEIHFNEFKFDKLQPKNTIAETNLQYKHFTIFLPFLVNTCKYPMYHQL